MKKLLATIAVLLLMTLLVSCGPQPGRAEPSPQPEPHPSQSAEEPEEEKPEPPAAEEPEENGEDTVRPEVKEALDAYEAFIDEYIAFMEEYKKAEGLELVSLSVKYMDLLEKMEEYEKEIDAMDSDLNDAEMRYYVEVTARVYEKLMKAAL